MSKLKTVKQIFKFFSQNKRIWLMPILIILVLLGLFIVMTEGSVLAPFIYTLF